MTTQAAPDRDTPGRLDLVVRVNRHVRAGIARLIVISLCIKL